jgi:septum site-determining protein MinC
VTAVAHPRHSIRFHSRSLHAMALAPEPPLADWLAELDAWLERSPGFFIGRPIILDLTSIDLSKPDVIELTKDLFARKIQVMGIEGGDPSWLELGLPPRIVSGGRRAGVVTSSAENASEGGAESGIETAIEALDNGPQIVAWKQQQPNSLLLDSPVRSGQYVEHLEGDVIIIGSVASGAEVVAGGSIHIYGTLRGRAIAGSGDPRARIFCRKLEAELLAIDGLYMTADDMAPVLRGHSVQVRLDGDSLMITAQD